MESHDEWTGGSDESFLRRVRTNSSDLATTTTPQVSSFDHTLSEKVPNRTAATPLPPSLSEPAPFEHYKLNGGEGFSFSPITGAIVFDNWEDAIGKFTTQGKEGEEEAQELAVEKELTEELIAKELEAQRLARRVAAKRSELSAAAATSSRAEASGGSSGGGMPLSPRRRSQQRERWERQIRSGIAVVGCACVALLAIVLSERREIAAAAIVALVSVALLLLHDASVAIAVLPSSHTHDERNAAAQTATEPSEGTAALKKSAEAEVALEVESEVESEVERAEESESSPASLPAAPNRVAAAAAASSPLHPRARMGASRTPPRRQQPRFHVEEPSHSSQSPSSHPERGASAEQIAADRDAAAAEKESLELTIAALRKELVARAAVHVETTAATSASHAAEVADLQALCAQSVALLEENEGARGEERGAARQLVDRNAP